MKCWWLVLGLLCLPATASADARARAEIGAARQAAEARYQMAEAECRQRFVVTPCIEEARGERRKALAALRERELQLDEVERRQRAAMRQEAVTRKRAQAASAARAASAAASSAAPAARAAASAPMIAPRPPAASAPREPIDGSAEAAAARAAQAAKRQQDAQARQARIEAREAERRTRQAGSADEARKGAPLPKP